MKHPSTTKLSLSQRVHSLFQGLLHPAPQGFQAQAWKLQRQVDMTLIYAIGFLLLLGLVMVYSASIGLPESPLFKGKGSTYFLIRQSAFLLIGLMLALLVFQVPVARWNAYAPYLFLFAVGLLVVVLIPFIGKLANNARRWIPVGPFTLQPSELMKFAVIVFAASYCVKKKEVITSFVNGMMPLLIVIIILGVLLLAEPDLGATVVMAAVALGILFLGGSSIMPIIVMGLGLIISASVVIATSNRARRVLAFLDPWSPEFAKTEGFQLTNSMIAFGRGELFGVGLGNSAEKLNHLSEAHTDFILAIVAEELGFIGICVVVFCYGLIIFKAFSIGRRAHEQNKQFDSLVAQGIGLWLGLQAGIHLCVNAGALPTKGLTLPFISYGGSALLMSMAAMALLVRIDYEGRLSQRGQLL